MGRAELNGNEVACLEWLPEKERWVTSLVSQGCDSKLLVRPCHLAVDPRELHERLGDQRGLVNSLLQRCFGMCDVPSLVSLRETSSEMCRLVDYYCPLTPVYPCAHCGEKLDCTFFTHEEQDQGAERRCRACSASTTEDCAKSLHEQPSSDWLSKHPGAEWLRKRSPCEYEALIARGMKEEANQMGNLLMPRP